MGLTNLDPDGKGWEKTLPGSDHQRRAPLSHEDRSLSRFPSRDGEEKPERCVRGASTGLLARRQGAEISRPRYKNGIFWLAFRETRPQVAFTAFRPTAKLAPAKGCAAETHAQIVPLTEAAIRNYYS